MRLSSCLVPCFAVLLALPSGATVMQVEGPQDSLAGAPTINHCTLRKAVLNANVDSAPYPQCAAGSGVDTIEFLSAMTVTFALAGANEDAGLTGDLDVTAPLIINGGGSIVDGAALDRVFHVHSGASLTINDLHIRNGSGNGGGGGILVDGGTLNLNNVTISACNAPNGDGGAIRVINGGTVNLNNCTISGNTAADHAGAIVVESGTGAITNTTITGNSSGFSNLTGGIRNTGTVTLRNTIVAGNAGINLPNLDGAFVSLGYNIIGNLGTMSGTPSVIATTGDQIGVADALLNLGPLQNNGGPTPTHALLAGSIALDQGHSSGSTTDQRGLTRPCDASTIANAAGGDGADVGAFEDQVLCSNTPPEAHDDAATVAEDSGVNTIAVLANDTDANSGDTLAVSGVSAASHGSAAVSPGGSAVTYAPGPDFFGLDSFTYTIDDGHGGTATASVIVTVTNVEDPPDAIDDSATITEDSGANTIHVLANDVDVDGDSLTITAVTPAAHGVVANGGNAVTYSPGHDFFGSDSFSYTVTDGHGGSDTATVHITVTNVNDPPVAVSDSYTMNQDTVLSVLSPGVLANDIDVDFDPLQSVLISGVSHGALSLNANGSLVYTPAPGFAGNDSFAYAANDGTVSSGAASVLIHVADTQPPVIAATVATRTLWPPNHDLVNAGFAASAVDNSSTPTLQVAVFSDEDDVTPGGGDQSPDASAIASGTLRLRSERSGTGDGRVYLIIVTASDAASNRSHSCLTVVVPFAQSAAAAASANQQASAAAAQCTATGLAPPSFFRVGDGPVVGPKQ